MWTLVASSALIFWDFYTTYKISPESATHREEIQLMRARE